MGRGLYYRLHVVLDSFGSWKSTNWPNISTYLSSPHETTLRNGVPSSIFSKCLSCYFCITFPLVQQVFSQNSDDPYSAWYKNMAASVCRWHHLWLLWLWNCSITNFAKLDTGRIDSCFDLPAHPFSDSFNMVIGNKPAKCALSLLEVAFQPALQSRLVSTWLHANLVSEKNEKAVHANLALVIDIFYII